MNLSYVSPFDVRQVMQRDDFEIFHRMDTAPGFIAPHSHDFYEIYFPRTEGVSYITGALFYSLNKRKYMHSVFHFFVLAGSVCHIIAVWDVLMEYLQ